MLEGKVSFIELAGNVTPITKSGDQLRFTFRAFHENRLPFNVRVRDLHEDPAARIYFMRDAKVPKGEPSPTPLCTLSFSLPDNILPDVSSEQDLLDADKSLDFLSDYSVGK